jgi:hypothetical protein
VSRRISPVSQLRGCVAIVIYWVVKNPGAVINPGVPSDFFSPLKSSKAVGASGPVASFSKFSVLSYPIEYMSSAMS